MITELTKAQEKKIPKYLNKWLEAGLRTKTVDKKKATTAVNFLYEKIMEREKPKYVIFLDSPMACQLACNLLKNTKFDYSQLGSQLRYKLDSQLGSQLRSQLRSQLGSQLYSQLDSQIGSQLYSQLDSQLDSQIGSQLRSQLDSQLGSQLRSQLDSQLYSQLRSQLDSQKLEYFYVGISNWWQNWYWYYDFILNELFKEKKKDFKLYEEFLEYSKELHYLWVFPEIAFVSDFPKQILRNEENALHSFDQAALLYRDTYSIYASNGIVMKKEYIETPKDQITKDMFLSEENADMRREMIKKAGLSRMLEVLNPKVMDEMKTKHGGNYKLLEIDFGDNQKFPFLQMKCPSTKNDHILGVGEECKTAKEAWCYLNNEAIFDDVSVVWEA